MTVTSWLLLISSRARFQPTLPAPTIRTYMALSGHPFEADLASHGRLEQLDRRLGGAHRLEALLGVPARPGGVEHPHHDPLDLEAAPRDLRDHQVGFVPARGGDEGARLLDAGRQQRVDLERRALREAPAALLPAGRVTALEQGDGLRVLVEDGDFVPFREHGVGDRAPHAPATDDQNEHPACTLPRRVRASRPPASLPRPQAGRGKTPFKGAFLP